MDKILAIAISLIKGLNHTQQLALGFYFSDVAQFEAARPSEMAQLIPERLVYRNPSNSELVRRARKIVEDVERSGARVVTYWDREYPHTLKRLFLPPYVLYVRGTLPPQDIHSIAIVGTRRPSASGRKAAFSLAAEFGLAGVPVISGLAAGIDAAAHWGSLKVQQQTVAVMGTGIDSVYPTANRQLAAKILQNDGALISEYPPFTPAGKFRFPERNRLISGMSKAVVIVQAPEKSGALITADHALDQHKDVFVHSAGTYGAVGAGGLKLSEQGADLIVNARMVLDAWDMHTTAHLETVQTDSFTPEQRLEEELEGRLLKFDGLWYRRVG